MRGELVVRFLLKGYETKRYEEDLYSDLGNFADRGSNLLPRAFLSKNPR